MDRIYLGEMNMSEVREYLKHGTTIIVPLGSTEQHGPHLPYLTDTIVPFEIAKRVAKKIAGLVAPPLPYGQSQVHYGFPGIISLMGKTLTIVLEDVAMSLARSGFRRIIFINGHGLNEQPMAVAIADVTASPNLPKGTKVFGLTYWNSMSQNVGEKFFSWKAGWHANIGETSAILAIDQTVVDMAEAPAEWPKAEEDGIALSFSTQQTGGWSRISKTGIWGDARKSTKELGEEFLRDATNGIVRAIKNYERSYERGSS